MLRKEEVTVCTKYKTVDKKVKPVVRPLPTNSKQKRKVVSEDPTLRKSVDIVYAFTSEAWMKLRIGQSGFLLPEDEI